MNKKLVFFIFAIFLLLIIVGYIVLNNKKLSPKNVEFLSLEWSEDINWNETCRCKNQYCEAKLESALHFLGFSEIKRQKDTYIQCVEIIDGVDRYKNESASLNIPSEYFVTFNNLDPRKSHVVEVCCGLQVGCETNNFIIGLKNKIRNFLGFEEYDYYQVCKTKAIDARCS